MKITHEKFELLHVLSSARGGKGALTHHWTTLIGLNRVHYGQENYRRLVWRLVTSLHKNPFGYHPFHLMQENLISI